MYLLSIFRFSAEPHPRLPFRRPNAPEAAPVAKVTVAAIAALIERKEAK
jgi:hypothetical protein